MLVNEVVYIANLGDSRAVLSRLEEDADAIPDEPTTLSSATARLDNNTLNTVGDSSCVLRLHSFACGCTFMPLAKIASLTTVS